MVPCFSPGILHIFFPVALRLGIGPCPLLSGLCDHDHSAPLDE